jgi:hypothetical protein
MITASQQIDKVATTLTHLAKSRAIPARDIQPLVLRLDRVANTLERRVASTKKKSKPR